MAESQSPLPIPHNVTPSLHDLHFSLTLSWTPGAKRLNLYCDRSWTNRPEKTHPFSLSFPEILYKSTTYYEHVTMGLKTKQSKPVIKSFKENLIRNPLRP